VLSGGVAENEVKVTKAHWRKVYGRIWRETLQEIRWDSAVRILRDVLIAAALAAAAWFSTHQIVWTAAVPIGVIATLAMGTFAWKLVTLPPRIVAEHDAALATIKAKLETEESKKALRIELAGFVQEGEALMVRCRDPNDTGLKDDANAWARRVEGRLAEILDVSYIPRFRSATGAPSNIMGNGAGNPNGEYWRGIMIRVFRLQEFIREGTSPGRAAPVML
jgi:hypothetical protein